MGWVDRKNCFLLEEGLKPFEKTIPSKQFYVCLQTFLTTTEGNNYKDTIRFSDEVNPADRKIIGFVNRVGVRQIDQIAYEGTQFLLDLRSIENRFGVPGTFSYAPEFLDIEQYFLFKEETILSCSLSIVAVAFIILAITASAPVTILVTICVLLVDLFLCGLIFYWNLTFNPLVVINIVVAIGLSVDYSAHIAHTYLVVSPPAHLNLTEKSEIRLYKTRIALSQMGSSVFHGGASTFLAIVALSPAKTYIFVVTFKLWFGIVVFGMSNGFLLLPVILSFIGPTNNVMDHKFVETDPEVALDPKEIQMAKSKIPNGANILVSPRDKPNN